MPQVERYVTKEGDTVDIIAFDRFGVHGAEASILNANQGLAALGPVLPIGTVVLIPLPEVRDRSVAPRLWD